MDILTETAIEHTELAYQGILRAEESVGLISMAYTILRACNYVQLYVMEHLPREPRTITSAPSTSANQEYKLLLAELWAVQLLPEAGVIVIGNTHGMQPYTACSLYIRAINIVHSTIDLALNSILLMNPEYTYDGQRERRLRSLLILTDLLNLTNETIYFCSPVIQQIQERLSLGSAAVYFNRLCAPLRGAGRIVQGALDRLAAITGTVGVACVAGLNVTLSAQLIGEGQNSLQQRVVLGVQIAVAAIATTALAWMARANLRRARHELGEENI